MRPKRESAAVLSGTAAPDTKEQQGHRKYTTHPRRTDQTRPFSVLISVWGRCKLWSRYPSREAAVAQVGALRRIGFDAFVADERESMPR